VADRQRGDSAVTTVVPGVYERIEKPKRRSKGVDLRKARKQDANKKQQTYISVSSRSIVKRATAFQITKTTTAL
jgi:hypothetical protein